MPVAVYAGQSLSSYLGAMIAHDPNQPLGMLFQAVIGNDKDYLAPRTSYMLDLRGPSVSVQTACSTSLVAVQMACQTLVARQCDIALAGGVAISVPRVTGYLYEPGMVLSPDGHCRSFDAKARGTIFTEGVGVLVLRRLHDALADGDSVLAVIRGAATANDGSLKLGFTAPGVDGQAAVVEMAHAMAGIDPGTVTYVEAHGTGTELGDPIEIAALTKAFRVHTSKRDFCGIGSVKTNIGHADVAAGVAGVIKTVLALQHRMLPPTLNFETPNPEIDFAGSPFHVITASTEWRRPDPATPRRAGVSAFGIGGTNAHVVLEEAPEPAPPAPSRPVQLLTLSAKTADALERATAAVAAHLTSQRELSLADVAYTLHTGRARFTHRRVVVAASGEEAVRSLEQRDGWRVASAVQPKKHCPVVFLFSGQGSQYVGMARGVYESEPVFREHVDECAATLAPGLGFDLREVLWPDVRGVEAARARLATTAVTQPALFVVEHALARLFMEWGVRPQAMLGHSIGEYVAACLAGVLSLRDALMLVAERGRLMEVAGGAMLAVPLAERDLRALLPGSLSIAAVNGPRLCAVSGPTAEIAAFAARLASENVTAQSIHTAAAFHSAMMEPILSRFTDAVKRVALGAPTIPYVSNVTGGWVTPADVADPAYWARHLRQTVRFWDGLQEVIREGDPLLLEVGPGRTLGSLARQASTAVRPLQVVASLRHPHDDQPDDAVLQAAAGRLWLAGVPIDWAGYHGRERRRRVPLPTYPFERQRHWMASVASFGPLAKASRPHALTKRADVAEWFYAPSWRRSVTRAVAGDPRASAWLVFADDRGVAGAIAHRLRGKGVRAITVVAGCEFGRPAVDAFTINPAVREDYDRLVAEVRTEPGVPLRVLHLWTLTCDNAVVPPSEALAEAQDLGFYSLLFLAQAFTKNGVREPVTIGVVVNGLHDVVGDEMFRSDRATIFGPAMVIPQEYPNVSCRVIDVVLPGAPGDAEMLAGQIVSELDHPAEVSVVAYRGRYRWVQSMEAVPVERPAVGEALRPRGVYVITGGFGGIALTFARHLAERVGARLVLVGRSPLPPREEWAAWLRRDGGAADGTVARIRAVEALEEAGAEVLPVSADVADREGMARVLAEARERFGAINGVIHAAGLVGRGIIQLKTPEVAERVIDPKLRGTVVLGELLRDDDLDFLLLCSSISVVTGGAGLVDYVGANAFLDAFARSQSQRNGAHRVCSVNWDLWQEVGMGLDADVPASMLAQGIRPVEGVEAFERVLGSPLDQVIVSTRDLPRMMEISRRALDGRQGSPEASRTNGTASPTPLAGRASVSTRFVAPATDLERTIAEIWQDVLGISSLGTQDDFFEAGGHSLLGTQVMLRLYDKLGIDVPLRMLFEARTIADFAPRVDAIWRTNGAQRDELKV